MPIVTGHLDDPVLFRRTIDDLIRDASFRMAEPRIAEDIAIRDSTERNRFDVNSPPVPAITYDETRLHEMTEASLLRLVLPACVQAARRRRFARISGTPFQRLIRRICRKPHTHPWAFHADLIAISTFVEAGHSIDDVHLLGPGTEWPIRRGKGAFCSHPRTVQSNYVSPGPITIDRHFVLDDSVCLLSIIPIGSSMARTPAPRQMNILSDDRSRILLQGISMPDTVLRGMVSAPIGSLVDHPIVERVRNLTICGISTHGSTSSTIDITLERRRAFLAEPPRNADLSHAELGNDLLIECGMQPTIVLPYQRDMHLA